MSRHPGLVAALFLPCLMLHAAVTHADETATPRVYEHRLIPIKSPKPLLGDHPEFVAPIESAGRFEAPMLIDDDGADLEVRAWRFSYNARAVIEVPNRLKA